MMTDQERKAYLITAATLIVILSLISIFSRGPQPTPSNINNNFGQTATSSLGTETDPKASAAIQQEIIDPNQVAADINQQLQTDRTVVIPAISNNSLNIIADSQQNIASYLSAVDQAVKSYNIDTEDTSKVLFEDSTKASALDQAQARTEQLISALYKMAVPRSALALHKASINTYGAYAKIIYLAKQNNLGLNNNVWPDVYYNYAIINKEAVIIQNEITNLKQNFKLQ